MNYAAGQPEGSGNATRLAATIALLLALAAALTVGAYFLGKASQPSLADGRERGAQVGEREGKARSGFEAYQVGLERGKKKGSKQTYQRSYDRSYDKQLVNAGYPPRPKPEPVTSTGPDAPSSEAPTEFFKSAP